ncbi:hypothetical protein FACS1894201_06910 [Bacteroidia bacterium]|nr:hypothetical protein FACS1894201_06910 [Bacteroidia bacterium]
MPYTIESLAPYELYSAKLKTDSLQLTFETSEKEIRTHTFTRNGELTRRKNDKYAGINFKYREDLVVKRLEDGYTVLEINRFNEYVEQHLDSVLNTLLDAKYLIIDLRENSVGNTTATYPLLKRLCNKDAFLTIASQTRIHDGIKKANGRWYKPYEDFYLMKAYRTIYPDTIKIQDTIKRFSMPIAILISKHTASAAEDFLIALYEWEDRPRLIGRPSMGSTGSSLMIKLPSSANATARICTHKVAYPYSMNTFKNIQPDILIDDTIYEYLQEIDKEMITAKKVLKINE